MYKPTMLARPHQSQCAGGSRGSFQPRQPSASPVPFPQGHSLPVKTQSEKSYSIPGQLRFPHLTVQNPFLPECPKDSTCNSWPSLGWTPWRSLFQGGCSAPSLSGICVFYHHLCQFCFCRLCYSPTRGEAGSQETLCRVFPWDWLQHAQQSYKSLACPRFICLVQSFIL